MASLIQQQPSVLNQEDEDELNNVTSTVNAANQPVALSPTATATVQPISNVSRSGNLYEAPRGPTSHIGPRPDEEGNAGGLDTGYKRPYVEERWTDGVAVDWGGDTSRNDNPNQWLDNVYGPDGIKDTDPMAGGTSDKNEVRQQPIGGPMGGSSYMDPQFEAWLRDMMGGPRDTAAEQAYLEQTMQQQMGAGIADMRAQGSMGGLGMVGATGALEGDLRRQGALDQAGAVFGLQQGARDEALARGQVGAGFFGEEAGRTFEQLEADKDRAREDAMLKMLQEYLLGPQDDAPGPDVPPDDPFGTDDDGNITGDAVWEDIMGGATDAGQAAAVFSGVPKEHKLKPGGPSPGATDINTVGQYTYWTEPDGTKWWFGTNSNENAEAIQPAVDAAENAINTGTEYLPGYSNFKNFLGV